MGKEGAAPKSDSKLNCDMMKFVSSFRRWEHSFSEDGCPPLNVKKRIEGKKTFGVKQVKIMSEVRLGCTEKIMW